MAGSAAQAMGCLPDGLASIASSAKQKRTRWLSHILWVNGRVWRERWADDPEVFVLNPLILLYRSEGIWAFVFRKLSIRLEV